MCHVYDHDVSPVVGCQVVPPSSEISTPPTIPPAASDAVPLMTTSLAPATWTFAAGEVIVEVGAVVSVDRVAGARPLTSEAGWMLPMSASRLTIAWRIAGSGVLTGPA